MQASPSDGDGLPVSPQVYALRVDGGALTELSVPWGPALLDQLAQLRRPDRDPTLVGRLAAVMRDILAPGWAELARTIVDASADGTLLLTLRSDAAELYALPWELTALPGSGQQLGRLAGVVLRHEWPGTSSAPEQPAPRPEGGRILLAWSAAGGGVPASEHVATLRAACSQDHPHGADGLVVLPHASLARLGEALGAAAQAGAGFAVLHLLCHGGRVGSTYGLVLDGDAGPVTVDAGGLRDLLAPFAGGLRLVVLAACDGGNTGELGNRLGSVAQALHRAGVQAVVASRSPISAQGSVTLATHLYHHLLAGPASLESAVAAARTQLAREHAQLDWAALQLHARARDGGATFPVVFRPFRGLLPFMAEHRRFFCGRDAEEAEVLGDLAALVRDGRPRLLIVAGASGSGKSSVVLAGTMATLLGVAGAAPAPEPLTRCGPWEVQVIRPGEAPMVRLERALIGRVDPRRPLLLIVDQFEELFGHVGDEATRQRFARRLWDEVSRDTGVHCILTLRIDFIGRCGELVLDRRGLRLDRVAYDEAHRVLVAQLGESQLRAAIEVAAARAGLSLQEGLTSKLLLDTAGEPGALPLLQYALDLLWQRRRGSLLTLAAYEELGGVVGALRTWADALIDALPPDSMAQARRTLTNLVRLTDDEAIDTRRRLELTALRPADEPERAAFDLALQRLAAARLVVLAEDGSQATVEVAHEALIRKWPRLRGWVREDREKLAVLEKLTQRARQCEEDGSLLTGVQLMHAEEIAGRYPRDLSDSVRDLLADSRRQARRARHLRRARTAGLGLLAALFGLLFMRASESARVAEEERARTARALEIAQTHEQKAIQASATAKALRINARVGGDHPRGHTLDLLLGIEAAREIADRGFIVPGDLLERLLALVSRTRPHHTLTGHVGPVRDARFDREGSMVTLDAAGELRTWSVGGSHQPATTRSLGPTAVARIAAGGRQVVRVSGRQVQIWDLAGSGDPIELESPGDEIAAVELSPDGRTLAAVHSEGFVRTWAAPWTAPPVTRSLQWTDSVVFSPDSEHLVFVGSEGLHRERTRDGGRARPLMQGQVPRRALFSPDGGTLVAIFPDFLALFVRDGDHYEDPRIVRVTMGAVVDAAFNVDGTRLATALEDDTVAIWQPTPIGAPVSASEAWIRTAVLRGHEGAVTRVAFSPDGRRVLTASSDATAGLWDLRKPGLPMEAVAPGGEVLAISPDGSLIAAATRSGTVALWSTHDMTMRARFRGLSPPIRSIEFSPDSGGLVAAGGDAAHVWSVADPETPVLVAQHQRAVTSAKFSPSGQRLVTASRDATVQIWRVHDGSAPLVLAGHTSAVIAAVFTGDGRSVVSAEENDRMLVWSADGEGKPRAFNGHASGGPPVLSPDGASMLWMGAGRSQVLRLDGKAEPINLDGHTRDVLHADFSPDGTRIATASRDQTVRVWSAASGAEQLRFEHQAAIDHVAFEPGGRRLLSVAQGVAKVWSLDDDGGLLVLPETVAVARWDPRGDGLLTHADDRLHLWSLSVQRLLAFACKHVGRNLTPAEWQTHKPGTAYRETCPQRPGALRTAGL